MKNKSLATVQFLDFLGNPIPKVQYEVKNTKTGQHVVKGVTNSKGCLYEIQRDKGTILDIYVKSIFQGTMLKVQTFTMSKDRMVVKIISPKILMNLKTLENKGSEGKYKRKTHIVRKGENLSLIAKNYGTTVRALENLNKISDPNKINIGDVIKLPMQIPASGNKIDQQESVSTRNTQKKSQNEPSKVLKKLEKDKESPALVRENIQKRATQRLNEWYEASKKSLNNLGKIEVKEDRSQAKGTPKSEAKNLCATNPQCIVGGKSELIREVNIRLAGFGGALPTDEFTELTAACIKQFQRDYMGMPETGKICGSVLSALDKFYYEYPISSFMQKAVCPCGQCSGYGNNERDVNSGNNIANEYPGLHRTLIWILKALNFYLKTELKSKELEVAYIASGYRCIKNNIKNKRTSVNHMGLALDIHFNKKGVRTKSVSDMELIRQLMSKKMRALESRVSDRIYLEPTKFNSGASGATTWVHFDIFNPNYG